jgi:pantoate--beta-alanine ligase
MQLADTIVAIHRQLLAWRQAGQRIAFVPTMGNLHAGHLALVHKARELADRVVVSIYVNPLQFNSSADLERYPVTLAEDRLQLQDGGCDVLFVPDVRQIYPYGIENSTRVSVPGLSDVLDGAFRPGHFVGVTTVVSKLFNIVQPDVAVFGEKDLQQLLLIRRMVADLLLPVEVVAVATVREADGLAMSSRNGRLSPAERHQAAGLYQVLSALREQWRRQCDKGACNFQALEQAAMTELEQQGLRPEYVSIRGGEALLEPQPGMSANNQPIFVLAAAWLGQTRLIDNLRL